MASTPSAGILKGEMDKQVKKKAATRLAPFGEVGRRGGIVTPEKQCLPCFLKVAGTFRNVEINFGVSSSTLKKYGIRNRHDRAAAAVKSHKTRRANGGALRNHIARCNSAIMRQLKAEAFAAKKMDELWHQHPERKAFMWRSNAKRNYLNNRAVPEYVIKKRMRSRVWKFCKFGISDIRTSKILGCSYKDFRKWIEDRFQPGMNWGNYGQWHIDHIRPCASFDLTKIESVMECFHHTNTCPMWGRDNIAKGSKWQGVKWRHNQIK